MVVKVYISGMSGNKEVMWYIDYYYCDFPE